MTGAEFALRVEGADNEYVAREFDAAMATLTAERDDWRQRHVDATTALITADRRIAHIEAHQKLWMDRYDDYREKATEMITALEAERDDERARAERAEQQLREREAALGNLVDAAGDYGHQLGCSSFEDDGSGCDCIRSAVATVAALRKDGR